MTASIQDLSKALFGNKDMLAVCAAIAGRKSVNAQDLAGELDVVYPQVHRLLGHLTRAGLLDRAPKERGEKFQWYKPATAKFWQAARELKDRAEVEEK